MFPVQILEVEFHFLKRSFQTCSSEIFYIECDGHFLQFLSHQEVLKTIATENYLLQF